MPSNDIYIIRKECMATIGRVGNMEHSEISLGKAGRKRWLGIRPTVRGVAMNPVDHPMGWRLKRKHPVAVILFLLGAY